MLIVIDLQFSVTFFKIFIHLHYVPQKKAKKAAVDLEGKRTNFKTFHEQMSEMTVPRIHLGFDNGSAPVVTDEADVDLATSHFGTVLLKWRDLNLSENFGNIMRR